MTVPRPDETLAVNFESVDPQGNVVDVCDASAIDLSMYHTQGP